MCLGAAVKVVRFGAACRVLFQGAAKGCLCRVMLHGVLLFEWCARRCRMPLHGAARYEAWAALQGLAARCLWQCGHCPDGDYVYAEERKASAWLPPKKHFAIWGLCWRNFCQTYICRISIHQLACNLSLLFRHISLSLLRPFLSICYDPVLSLTVILQSLFSSLNYSNYRKVSSLNLSSPMFSDVLRCSPVFNLLRVSHLSTLEPGQLNHRSAFLGKAGSGRQTARWNCMLKHGTLPRQHSTSGQHRFQ